MVTTEDAPGQGSTASLYLVRAGSSSSETRPRPFSGAGGGGARCSPAIPRCSRRLVRGTGRVISSPRPSFLFLILLHSPRSPQSSFEIALRPRRGQVEERVGWVGILLLLLIDLYLLPLFRFWGEISEAFLLIIIRLSTLFYILHAFQCTAFISSIVSKLVLMYSCHANSVY